VNGTANSFAFKLNDCGCCEGLAASTPGEIANRPGLDAIVYRVGSHSEFLNSMLAQLSSQRFPTLAALRTRDEDDFSLALLDAWATVADVLTFYQERIANESFLSTATERRSLLDQARLIGYELRPGVAASTFLAFTLEQAPGAPTSAQIRIGTKMQSVPGPDEKPQTFETVEEIEARSAWNSLPAKATEFVLPRFGDTTIYLQGSSLNLKPGDTILLVGEEREKDAGSERWDCRQVSRIECNFELDRTKITLDRGLGEIIPHVEPAAKNPKVYALRLRTALFGSNAPDWRAMPDSVKAAYVGWTAAERVPLSYAEWPDFNIAAISDPPTTAATGTGLYAEFYEGINFSQRKLSRTDAQVDFDWGSGKPAPEINADAFSVRWTGWVQPSSTDRYTFYTVSDDGVRLWVDGRLLIDNWTDHPPTENSGSIALSAGRKYDVKLEYYERGGEARIQLRWSASSVPKAVIPQSRLYPRDIHTVQLEGVHSQILRDSWLLLSNPEYQELYRVASVAEDARVNFTLSSKTMRLALQGENLRERFNERLRGTAVFAQSEELPMAEQPIHTPVSGKFVELARPVEGLLPGRLLVVSGVDTVSGKQVSEVVTLQDTGPSAAATKLNFTTTLQHIFRRESVVIHANVCRGTHGETVQEVLGSGSADQPFQRFTLRQSPLTYVSASNPSGAESTLRIHVDELEWHEVPTLYGRKQTERVFVTQTSDEGRTTVKFGDGRTGARLPKGRENVRATYRKGIGLDGLVQAGQLSLLMTRPLGVKSVVNPLRASGAADRESLEDARGNAPLTVLTLDRIVSLLDYENFTRAYAGIAKSHATWTGSGRTRRVFLTVAGPHAAAIKSLEQPYENLLSALNRAGDPNVRFCVKSFRDVPFRIVGTFRVAADHVPERVKAAVDAALLAHFSFEARSFGQSVTLSEVVAVVQNVPGVLMVDVDDIVRLTGGGLISGRLLAAMPEGELAAELLTLASTQLDTLQVTL